MAMRANSGAALGTFVRGTKVMWDGEILGAAVGEAARFNEGV